MAPLELAFRLAVAALVIVAPTGLFLGLWHLLLRMRDGELVGQVLEDERVAVEWSSGRFARPSILTAIQPTGSQGATCPHCGASNPPGAVVCTHCLDRL